MECRINAEDPETFVPSPGRVTVWVPPGGRNVRVDSHLFAGYSVPPHYDSLIAKIIVHGADRAESIARMQRALAETLIEGIKTTIPYHQKLLSDPAFVSGEFSRSRASSTRSSVRLPSPLYVILDGRRRAGAPCPPCSRPCSRAARGSSSSATRRAPWSTSCPWPMPSARDAGRQGRSSS